ncbi:PREDICTED: centrosomal protein of 72 kDa isoform X1 [Crocodylus porosus]|uniref:centrosomal protein of 72 kDa isoform X1 n=1 Tax=Crocodylus porosus TaxID=8502 RepID=UPI00093B0637|nr:PREDICTED: centrosomal protein of 72 kDa isoform X1 [Crocodylus porosus]
MAVLTEEAVRERVHLRHQNLADVRSLSLPGTYHEKITHLGNALKNFTRLKSLDLSRNALVSLEGIQYLTFLEKLNLYYNQITSLSEVFRLHSLTTLKEVDLRLNPVIKNESDYRLFVVHMLPNLRRLDDRPVRDSERKASLLHFATDHAYELKNSSPAARGNEMERPGPARVQYIHSMSKKCSVLDEEDEAVLNLIAKCEWDLSKPPRITGSAKKDPEVEFHTLQSIREIDDKDLIKNQKPDVRPTSRQTWKQQQANMPVVKKDVSSENRKTSKFQDADEEYRSLPYCSPTPAVEQNIIKQGFEKRKNSKVTFSENKTQDPPKGDPNLKFLDEAEAYRKIRACANFTPHPDSQEIDEPVISSSKVHTQAQKIYNTLLVSGSYCNGTLHNGRDQPIQKQTYSAALEKNNGQSSVNTSLSKQKTIEESDRIFLPSQEPEPEEKRPHRKTVGVREVSPETHEKPSANKHPYEATPIECLLDLVDRYWNGCKSLHCNEKFLSQARPLLGGMQKFAPTDQCKDSSTMHQEMTNLLLDKQALQNNLSEQKQRHNIKISSLTSELSNAQRERNILKQRLDQLLEENATLKARLLNMEQNVKNADASTSLELQLTELQSHNQQLTNENVILKERLQQHDKIQQLIEMLQESHRTLVSTNEHLLQELAETRIQHKSEVEQLHWSYNQLKKTMDKFPHSNTDNNRC